MGNAGGTKHFFDGRAWVSIRTCLSLTIKWPCVIYRLGGKSVKSNLVENFDLITRNCPAHDFLICLASAPGGCYWAESLGPRGSFLQLITLQGWVHSLRRMPKRLSIFWFSCTWVSICVWLPTIKRLCVIYWLVGKSVKIAIMSKILLWWHWLVPFLVFWEFAWFSCQMSVIGQNRLVSGSLPHRLYLFCWVEFVVRLLRQPNWGMPTGSSIFLV